MAFSRKNATLMYQVSFKRRQSMLAATAWRTGRQWRLKGIFKLLFARFCITAKNEKLTYD